MEHGGAIECSIIDSPILRKDTVTVSARDLVKIIFVAVTPSAELLPLLENRVGNEFPDFESAVERMGDPMAENDFAELLQLVSEHVATINPVAKALAKFRK